MARAFHFLLRRGSAILRLAVHLAMVKAVGLVACRRLETEKESRQAAAVAAVFAAHSSPELGCFFPGADLSCLQTCLVIADLATAAGLSAAARPDLVVAAGSAVAVVGFVVAAAVVAFDPACSACSACPVCLFAAVTEKGRAVVAAFCFSALRFFFLHSRNYPSPLCFADRV